MRKLCKSERGSVNIYLIIIILPVFIFHAVLIDFARIKIAEKQSELAAQAAVRSVLSTFDKDLQDYGLYGTGLDQASADTVFKEIMEQNLVPTSRPNTIYDDIGKAIDDIEEAMNGNSPTEDNDYLKLIRPELKESSVVLNKERFSLANQPNIFHRQVLEEMKYKAPIEVTIALLSKFLDDNGSNGASELQNEVEEGHEQIESVEEFQDKVEERDNAINDLMNAIDQAKLANYKGIINPAPANKTLCQTADTCKNINPVKTIYDISNQGTYIFYHASDDEALVAYYKSASTFIVNDVLSGTNQIPSTLTSIEKQIQKTINLDSQVETLLNKMNSNASSEDSLNPELYVYKNQLNKMKSETGLAAQHFPEFQNQLTTMKSYIDPSSQTPLRNTVQSVNESFLKYDENLRNVSNEKTNIDTFINKRKQLENAEAENAANEQLKKQGVEQKSLEDGINSQEKLKDDESSSNNFDELEKLYDLYNTANDPDKEKPHEPGDYEDEDKEESALDILGMLSNILESLRDEVYLNEFALSKFNYHTWKKEDAYELSFNKPHKIENEEVEYILYGFHGSNLNFAAAYGEIYLIRLALRIVEGLKIIKGPPPVIVIGAIIYGIAMAFYDTQRIVNGDEDVRLIPEQLIDIDFPFNYKDYLRLFLLLHSNNEKMMARTQALIHYNTNKNLQDHLAYIEGKYKTSLRLWFVPGIMKALNITGALDGRVEGQYYIFPEKITASSY